MATLVPCPGCARHVRANENKCPFCDASIDATASRGRSLEPMPADRLLARTAITFALGAVTTLAACGKENAEKPPSPIDNNNMNAAPAYGVPVIMEDAAVQPAPPTSTPTPMTTDASAPKTPAPKK